MNAPEPVTVVFVLHALAGGGAERVAVQLLRHLDRNRFRPVLALFRVEGPYLNDVPKDVPVIDLKKAKRTDWPGAIGRLANVLRKEHARIVFGFDWHANLAAIAAAKLARTNARVIAGVRSHESSYIPNLAGKVQRLRRMTIRRLYPRADVVLANSEAVTRDLAENFAIPPDKLATIYNPVDIDAIEERAAAKIAEPCFDDGTPVVVAAGRLIPLKGFDVLIEALSHVRRETPCKLLILGEGPDEARLLACAASQGVADNVIFAGFQSNPYNAMKRAHVFVLSSYTEGFPNVVLEAMACGTPVVATRCSAGPEELITDTVDGLLVPPGDAPAMAEAIASLLRSDERRQSIGAAGRARVQSFGLDKTIAAFEDLFTQLANTAPVSP